MLVLIRLIIKKITNLKPLATKIFYKRQISNKKYILVQKRIIKAT